MPACRSLKQGTHPHHPPSHPGTDHSLVNDNSGSTPFLFQTSLLEPQTTELPYLISVRHASRMVPLLCEVAEERDSGQPASNQLTSNQSTSQPVSQSASQQVNQLACQPASKSARPRHLRGADSSHTVPRPRHTRVPQATTRHAAEAMLLAMMTGRSAAPGSG